MLKSIKRGFTLVELAITTALLATLVGAIVFAVGTGKDAAETRVGNATGAISSYTALNDTVPGSGTSVG